MTESSTVEPFQSPHHEYSPSSSDDQQESHNPLQERSNDFISLEVDLATRETISPSSLDDGMQPHPSSRLSPHDSVPLVPLQTESGGGDGGNIESPGENLINSTRTVEETGAGTQTGESPSESNQNLFQAEQETSSSPHTVTLVIRALITMMRCVLYFWFSFFWSTFTNHMPTRQLYTVSIILLSIHSMLQKMFEYLPYLLRSIIDYIGVEDILRELNAPNYSTPKPSPEVSTLEKMMEGFMGRHDSAGLGNLLSVVSPGAYSVGQLARTVASSTISTHSGLGGEEGTAAGVVRLLETPIVSIMLPTAILSVFLLLTMSMFLCMHVVFQILMVFSSYIAGTSRTSSLSGFLSSFIVWGILGMLLLETILPVICLSIGIYLSFSVGGVVWSSFVGIVCFIGFFLKYSRRAIYQGLQHAHRNVSAND